MLAGARGASCTFAGAGRELEAPVLFQPTLHPTLPPTAACGAPTRPARPRRIAPIGGKTAAFLAFLLAGAAGCASPPDAVSLPQPCAHAGRCLAYVEDVRSRVAEQWRSAAADASGAVRLRFGLDRAGRVFLIDVLGADSAPLARNCVAAFRAAEPFEPPPPDLAGQVFVMTLEFGARSTAKR